MQNRVRELQEEVKVHEGIRKKDKSTGSLMWIKLRQAKERAIDAEEMAQELSFLLQVCATGLCIAWHSDAELNCKVHACCHAQPGILGVTCWQQEMSVFMHAPHACCSSWTSHAQGVQGNMPQVINMLLTENEELTEKFNAMVRASMQPGVPSLGQRLTPDCIAVAADHAAEAAAGGCRSACIWEEQPHR